MLRAILAATVLLLAGCAQRGPAPAAESFSFALIGDVPYSTGAEPAFERMLQQIDDDPSIRFVLHAGDLKGSGEPCSDGLLLRRLAQLQRVRTALVYAPGDNDWTDCHFVKERRIDPLDELGKVRTAFYPPGRSLGQRTMPVASQSQDPRYAQFRENLRWTHGGVTFATLHMVGSNDNFGRTPEMNAEHAERAAANLAWMREAFALARRDGSLGVVLLTQANPGFESHWTPELLGRYFRNFAGVKPPIPPRPSAYDGFIGALAEEVARYTRPVAFIHGDTHLFRIDQPLLDPVTQRTFTQFTRMETFGNPDTRWTRVIVDPSDPALFTFRAESGKQ